MAKRRAGSEDASPHSKRRKLSDNRPAIPKPGEISTVKQLQNILAFRQDAGPETKRNIEAFKVFLESIAHSQDIALQTSRRHLLLEYLQFRPMSQAEGASAHVSDLVKNWSFAAQSNNESLSTAVPAVLALLLKTISHHVDFRDVGANICQLLLQDDQLRLFERGLSAQKSKDRLLSSCLRLLTEIVSFDGGSSAKRLYRMKDVTFKRLDTFLSLRPDTKSMQSSSRKRPSTRSTALRYLFANLRLQDHAAKTEIFANGKLLRSIFYNIKEDSPSMIREILHVVRDDILKDEKIPRRIKGRIFNDQILSSIATLYNYHSDDSTSQVDNSNPEIGNIPAIAHTFLLSLCTTPEYGILTGQDNRLSGVESEEVPSSTIIDPKDPDTVYQNVGKPVTIRNHSLASFLQTLRPYASQLHQSLVLSIFQAAPELVPDYFTRKKSFSFDPKLTATWVGFAAFILSTIELPLHNDIVKRGVLGSFPPPSSQIIESILPTQLSPKITSRGLNQNILILKLFTIKILSAAFDKFARTIRYIRSASRNRNGDHAKVWGGAGSALVGEFCQRCPDMSHVITVFRSCTSEDLVLREASARLLLLYYQHLPQIALEQKFDVSIALSAAFDRQTTITQPLISPGLEPLIFEHLLDNQKLSLFGSGLKCCKTLEDKGMRRSLQALLQSTLTEGLSLGYQGGRHLLGSLLMSLDKSRDWQPTDALFELLDDCFVRLSKKAARYHQDLLEQMVEVYGDGTKEIEWLGGELLVVISEQWPFFEKSATVPDFESTSRWLSCYLYTKEQSCADPKLLRHFRHHIRSITTNNECRKMLKKTPEDCIEESLDSDREKANDSASLSADTQIVEPLREAETQHDEWEPPLPPSPENEDHPGLGSWKHCEVEEAIAEGAIGELMLCLCSKYADIRKQALIELRLWMKKLQTSQYSEREPLHLLAGEIIETVNNLETDSPLPYFAGTAAAEFCMILSNPLHFLYAKVNRFLNKGPVWKVKKLPSYWVDQILMHSPTKDDGHYKEMRWLLDILIDGLRTKEASRRKPIHHSKR
ncbi:MAG: hypothetical protein Q9170_001225 [Blastenia crenularia]